MGCNRVEMNAFAPISDLCHFSLSQFRKISSFLLIVYLVMTLKRLINSIGRYRNSEEINNNKGGQQQQPAQIVVIARQ